MNQPANRQVIKYVFSFDDGLNVEFPVQDFSEALRGIKTGEAAPWMMLDQFRCGDCGLPPGADKLCPAAVAIKPIIDFLGKRVSFEKVHLTCYLNDIKMETRVPLQKATRSLIGLLLTFSDCPIMMKLRPMAYFHVPLADKDHTEFRFIGMYLIAQYLRRSANLPSDEDLKHLPDLFGTIHRVNRNLARRIRAVAEADATVNGLVLLDAFAESVEMQVEQFLEGMKPFFSTYMSD